MNYFIKCNQQLNLALPILQKITNKTIILQNYKLLQGHCDGLATAVRFLDPTKVNRILLSNNGLTGKQFAAILRGLQYLRDFKSIVYKQNQFS